MAEITLSDKGAGEVLLALVGIGLCSLLDEREVEENLAEKVLFNPYVMSLLIESEADETLLDAIHRGTELGDIRRLAPHSSVDTLKEIRTGLLKIVKARQQTIIRSEKLTYNFAADAK